MSNIKAWLVTAVLLAAAQAGATPTPQGLIPRSEIFGNPTRTSLTLSPNGRWMAYLAPHDGVMNIWVAPFGKWEQAKPLTQEKKRGLRSYVWAENGEQLLYLQDNDGDENWRIYLVDLASSSIKVLTPTGKVAAQIFHTSQKHQHDILIGLNDRDPRYHDIYRVNLKTGKRKLVLKNEGFQSFKADDDLKLRLALKQLSDGGSEIYRLDAKGKTEPKPLFVIKGEDSLTTETLGFDSSGQLLYLVDSRDQDKAVLSEIDLKTNKLRVLHAAKKADVDNLLFDPKTLKPQAASENYLKPEWTAIDPMIQPDFDFLNREAHGQWNVVSRTHDDKFWALTIDRVTEPVAYYLYERPNQKLTRLFSTRPVLEGKKLAPMYGIEITARDGTVLPSYLSLPADSDLDRNGKPAQALPMVLLVHGGPWARDFYGFNSTHQWLANRGLAVLSVNYRGSTGFGKNFVNKAVREFAGAMHNDLIDAVDWAVKEGVAQKDKIAIMGGSYGGYATLVGLTFTPDTFACGVDIVGPSNLVTLIESFPAYWQPLMEGSWYKFAGDPRNEAERKDLMARSPISRVDQIKRPLLIGHGANDPRVVQKESDQIVAAMKSKSIPVTYALYSDEGHGFVRPQNRISFNSLAENFLSKCLGSPAQPIGEDLQGSSLQVPEGASYIPGLQDATKGQSSTQP